MIRLHISGLVNSLIQKQITIQHKMMMLTVVFYFCSFKKFTIKKGKPTTH